MLMEIIMIDCNTKSELDIQLFVRSGSSLLPVFITSVKNCAKDTRKNCTKSKIPSCNHLTAMISVVIVLNSMAVLTLL